MIKLFAGTVCLGALVLHYPRVAHWLVSHPISTGIALGALAGTATLRGWFR